MRNNKKLIIISPYENVQTIIITSTIETFERCHIHALVSLHKNVPCNFFFVFNINIFSYLVEDLLPKRYNIVLHNFSSYFLTISFTHPWMKFLVPLSFWFLIQRSPWSYDIQRSLSFEISIAQNSFHQILKFEITLTINHIQKPKPSCNNFEHLPSFNF